MSPTTRTRPGRILQMLAAAAPVLVVAACGDDGPAGLAREGCGPLPYFTVSPVAFSDIDFVAVFGGLGAPGHTLPTAHSGILLTREDVPVVSPGRIQINTVRRVTYESSPTRQGERDYAVFFSVCEDVEGWFGHLTELAPDLPDNAAGEGCERYSTSDETVESCETEVGEIVLEAGQALGAAGLSAERGFLSIDFGLLDERVQNFYVTPSRYPTPTFHAVCPYEYFDAGTRDALLSRLRDGARPEEVPSGEPRCGTMEVDVAGTAKGVWAEQGVTGPVQGDETRYMTLADYPYNPQLRLALSLGPAQLGARVAVVPRETAGRVNRAFEGVQPDGTIYCYTPPDMSDFDFGNSWLIRLTSDTTLQIEWIQHAGEPGPCGDDPSTWELGPSAMAMMR